MKNTQPKKVTPESLEAELEATRKELSDTVDQLVEQLDPRKQVQELTDTAKVKVSEAGEYALDTLEEAKAGDTKALATVACVAGGVLLLGGLVLRRIFRH